MSAPWEDFGGGTAVETPPWEDFGAVDSIKGKRQLPDATPDKVPLLARVGAALEPMVEPLTMSGLLNQPARFGRALGLVSPAAPDPFTQELQLIPQTPPGFANALARVAVPGLTQLAVPQATDVAAGAIQSGSDFLTGLSRVDMLPFLAAAGGPKVVQAAIAALFAGESSKNLGTATGEVVGNPDASWRDVGQGVGVDVLNAAIAGGIPIKAVEASGKPAPATGQKPQFEPTAEGVKREALGALEAARLGASEPAVALRKQIKSLVEEEAQKLAQGQDLTPEQKMFDTPIIGQEVQGQSIIQPMPPRPNQPTGVVAVPGTPGAVPAAEAVGGRLSWNAPAEQGLPTARQGGFALPPEALAKLEEVKPVDVQPPIVYKGQQEFPGRAPLELYNLTEDVGTFKKGSTVTKETVQKLFPEWKGGEQSAKEMQDPQGEVVSGQQTRGVPPEGVVGPSGGTALRRIPPSITAIPQYSQGRRVSGANVSRSLDLLGASMYDKAYSKTLTKELVQNAFDAIKDSKEKAIRLDIDRENQTISISDTGVGMSPEVVVTKLLPAFESGKDATTAAGGYGLAKVAVFGGAENFKVTTVAYVPNVGKLRTTLTGTGADWLKFVNEGADVPTVLNKPGVFKVGNLLVEVVSDPAAKLGTRFDIKHKEGKFDAYDARSMFEQTAKNEPGNVTFVDPFGETIQHDLAATAPVQKTIEVPGATIEIRFDATDTPARLYDIPVLNNGLTQFSLSFFEDVKLPPIKVNVKPNVAVTDQAYPFTNNRDSLKSEAKIAVEKYIKEVTNQYKQTVLDTYRKRMSAHEQIAGTSTVFLDVSGKLSKDAVTQITWNPQVSALAKGLAKVHQAAFGYLNKRYGPHWESARFSGFANGGGFQGVRFGTPIKGSEGQIYYDLKPLLDEAFSDVHAGKYTPEEAPLALGERLAGVVLHEVAHQISSYEGETHAVAMTELAGPMSAAIAKTIKAVQTTFKDSKQLQEFYDWYIDRVKDAVLPEHEASAIIRQGQREQAARAEDVQFSGKAREGVGQPESRTTLAGKLESLKLKTDQDMLFSLPDPKAIAGVSKMVWNTGIDLAIQSVKAGVEVAKVVDDTIKYWQKNAHAKFDEASARIRLEQVLAPKVKKVEPEAAKPMTLETAPKEVAKEVEARLANEENIWQRFVKKNFEVRTPPRVFQAEKPAPQLTLDVFAQAIKDAKPAREATDILQQQARKKVEARLKKALASADGPGAIAEVRKAFSGFQGRVDLEPFAAKMSAGELNLLFNHLLTHKEFGGYAHRIGDHYDALYKLVFDGTLPQPHHIETFERVFGPKVAEALVKKGRNSTGFWHTFAEVSGATKSMKASFDLSAPLRQGLFVSLAHPQVAGQALVKQIRAFGNREYSNALDATLRTGEQAEIRKEAGLSLPQQEGYAITHKMEQREENYPSHFMQQLLDVKGKNAGAKVAIALPKLIAHGLAGSERAFVTYLNWMRANVFDSVDAELVKQIKNKDELAQARRQLALLINASTGRGNVRGSELINALMFSQKYAVSRVELPYRLAEGMARHPKDALGKEAAKQTVGAVATWMGLYALVQAGNELFKWKMKFNLDTPTSTDFMKIRLPNGTTVDFSGGESTYARFVATAVTGHTTNPKTGRAKTAWDKAVLGGFVEGKAAPLPGTGWAALHGKSQSGRKLSVGSVLTDLTVPISVENLWEALDEHGMAGVPLMIPDVFGAGVQTPFKK